MPHTLSAAEAVMTAIARIVRPKCWAATLAFLVFAMMPALAIDFGRGALPVAFEPDAPVALGTHGRIDLAGTIEGTSQVTLVIRIDDGASIDYQSRMNDERAMPPGPFALSFDVATLRANNGRKLDTNDIRRIIVFIVGPGTGQIWHLAHAADGSSAAPDPVAAREARSFGSGALPIKIAPGSAAFSERDEIRIEGINADSAPAALALRIDDKASSSYQTRYNDERMVPPGRFQFSVGLKGLRTISGRSLDPAAISQIILFPWKDKPNVTITRFEAVPEARLPTGARGYALGAADAPLPAGFERIAPTDARIAGRGPVSAFRRPAPDPLIANGVRGIRTVRLQAPASRVRVTVWSEDPGEWELLPHPFVRRIQVNGRDAVNEAWSADDWVAKRYLRGASREHSPKDDAWTAYGSLRGMPATIDVDAGREGIVVELSGGDMSAYVLNAVLVEPVVASSPPATPSAAQAFVTDKRAEWYRNTLPVAPTPAQNDGVTRIGMDFATGTRAQIPALKAVAAADTGVAMPFEIVSVAGTSRPRITIAAPQLGTIKLTARLWVAQWRLQRQDSILQLKNDRLMADTSSLPIAPGTARGYELWIDVPKSAPAGIYKGKIEIASEIVTQTIPLEITVPHVQLPPAAKPAGFYLARAPHLGYFAGLTIERERQVDCDLELMRGFGLANTAPPIEGLGKTDLGTFATDMRRASARGIAPGWLIYNPLNALVETQGQARAAETVGRLEDLITAQAMPQPLWSVADEPSNADQGGASLEDWVRLLRTKAPRARLAGHLNNPADRRFMPLFDTVIVNDGYGIDVAQLDDLAKTGTGLWLYNTFAPRQTAGLWLWRTKAQRYVQWHARMPTADAFDPTDGREADFQMIYPTQQVCPTQPDIHRDLLRMAEGVVDQRWLLWLDAQSTPDAVKLRGELRAMFNGPFQVAKSLSRAQLEDIRARIIAVALK